jgi:hypothetical protein
MRYKKLRRRARKLALGGVIAALLLDIVLGSALGLWYD